MTKDLQTGGGKGRGQKLKELLTPKVRVHFIGIGGIGMSGLAELLQSSGAVVTGSDLVENKQSQRLKTLGISVFTGHKAGNVGKVDCVVYSSAIGKDNVEYREALRLHLPVMSRSEALSEVMRLKRGLVVAGTHGKTTTTSLLAQMFLYNKKDPTVMIGGIPSTMSSPVHVGRDRWFIVESDESDGGFKHLFAEVALITNIDTDHIDHYGSFKKLKAAFFSFASKIPFYGFIVACGDQALLRKLLKPLSQKVIFYGFNSNNHFVLKKLKACRYQVFFKNKKLGSLQVPLYGEMNGLNALGALAGAMTVGLSFRECQVALRHFKGIERRMQKKGQARGVQFYDDYAHHPTEIKAVLSAFREKTRGRRVVVVFQPHRFSRTRQCWHPFLTCFQSADLVFVTDIYPASESPLPGVNSQKLAAQIKHPRCTYLPVQNLSTALPRVLKKGDVLISMGAGSVDKYGEQILKALRQGGRQV